MRIYYVVYVNARIDKPLIYKYKFVNPKSKLFKKTELLAH